VRPPIGINAPFTVVRTAGRCPCAAKLRPVRSRGSGGRGWHRDEPTRASRRSRTTGQRPDAAPLVRDRRRRGRPRAGHFHAKPDKLPDQLFRSALTVVSSRGNARLVPRNKHGVVRLEHLPDPAGEPAPLGLDQVTHDFVHAPVFSKRDETPSLRWGIHEAALPRRRRKRRSRRRRCQAREHRFHSVQSYLPVSPKVHEDKQ